MVKKGELTKVELTYVEEELKNDKDQHFDVESKNWDICKDTNVCLGYKAIQHKGQTVVRIAYECPTCKYIYLRIMIFENGKIIKNIIDRKVI